jgi:hypothetical protein
MSATIIDSLIVQLGLDSKPMDNAAPKAVKGLRDIEKQGDSAGASIGELSAAMAGFLTLIGGTVAIKSFITDAITATAEIGRLSKNLELSSESITEWGTASERMGGSAQALRGTMQMLSRAQTEFQLTGNSGLLPYFTMLRVNFDALQSQNPEQQLLSLASGFERLEQARGRAFANNVGTSMGIDQGTMNLLLMNRKELEIYLKRQKDYADQVAKFVPMATKFQDQLVGMRQKFTVLGYTLLNEAAPALEKFIGFLEHVGDWVSQNKQFVEDFLKIMAVGIGAVALAALPIEATTVAIVALAAGFALLWDDYQTWAKGGKSAFNWGDFAEGLDVTKDKILAVARGFKEAYEWWNKWMNRGHENDPKWMGVPQSGHKGTTLDPVTKQRISTGTGNARLDSILRPSAKPGGSLSDAIAHQEGFYAKGGTPNRPQRNHNPGNIKMGHFAESHGAIGHDGPFAIFPSDAVGMAALNTLLASPAYAGLSVDQAITKYAPPSENNTAAYIASVKKSMGSTQGSGNAAAMLSGIPGASLLAANASPSAPGASGSSIDRSSQTTIGSITVNTQATDARGMVDDMNQSMDYLFASQANKGLF